MISFSKVLVVTPANSIKQAVTSRAVRLAEKPQALLTLFSVAEPPLNEHLAGLSTLPLPTFMQKLLEHQREELELAATDLRADYAKVEISNAIGTPFLEVIKKVQQEKFELVVLASKATNRTAKRFFGSTTIHLMRKCPCPIWTVAEYEPTHIKRITATVDVYAPTEQGLKLNESILQWASALAVQEQAELHIIHAWQLPGEDYLTGWGATYTSDIDRYELLMKEETERKKHLDKLIKNHVLSSLTPIVTLIHGKAQEVIPKYLEDKQTELVVMGTLCRTGIPGFFIGNTAESILNEVCCSVLSLKPEGFISPVK